MRLSKSLFDNAIKALSFCQMGLTRNCMNIQPKAYIYASDKLAVFYFLTTRYAEPYLVLLLFNQSIVRDMPSRIWFFCSSINSERYAEPHLVLLLFNPLIVRHSHFSTSLVRSKNSRSAFLP